TRIGPIVRMFVDNDVFVVYIAERAENGSAVLFDRLDAIETRGAHTQVHGATASVTSSMMVAAACYDPSVPTSRRPLSTCSRRSDPSIMSGAIRAAMSLSGSCPKSRWTAA